MQSASLQYIIRDQNKTRKTDSTFYQWAIHLCKGCFYIIHQNPIIRIIWINSTCSLLSCRYRVGEPNAKLSTQTKLGPAKSKMTPSSLHIPMWPMQGKNHDSRGSGVHTMQQGNRLLAGSICFNSVSFSSIVKLRSSFDPIAYNEETLINSHTQKRKQALKISSKT